MRVVIATAARDDLRRIGDFIAQDNPPRALSFVQELREKARDLGEWPDRFPLVHPQRSLRKRTFGNYLILYRVEIDRVLVLRFVHASQDYGSMLQPDV